MSWMYILRLLRLQSLLSGTLQPRNHVSLLIVRRPNAEVFLRQAKLCDSSLQLEKLTGEDPPLGSRTSPWRLALEFRGEREGRLGAH